MGFIYKVTNQVNGKSYIGQTTLDIQLRFNQHLRESLRKTNNLRPFHNAILKYGKDKFLLQLVEEVDNDLLDEREQYWIEYYRTYIGFKDCNGYNATLGGESTRLYDYRIIVDDYLKTNSKVETAKNLNCCVQTVTRALETYNIPVVSNNQGRKIQRISEDGKIIEYSSIRNAAEEISNEQNRNLQTVRKRINYLLLHAPEQKAYGFFWKIV